MLYNYAKLCNLTNSMDTSSNRRYLIIHRTICAYGDSRLCSLDSPFPFKERGIKGVRSNKQSHTPFDTPVSQCYDGLKRRLEAAHKL